MLRTLVLVLMGSFLLACGSSPAPAPAPALAPAAPAAPTPAPATDDPDRRLTRAECAEGVDHAIALFAAEPAMAEAAATMRNGRDGFIAQCEATAAVRDHRCLMGAKSSHELGLCPMPGTR